MLFYAVVIAVYGARAVRKKPAPAGARGAISKLAPPAPQIFKGNYPGRLNRRGSLKAKFIFLLEGGAWQGGAWLGRFFSTGRAGLGRFFGLSYISDGTHIKTVHSHYTKSWHRVA